MFINKRWIQKNSDSSLKLVTWWSCSFISVHAMKTSWLKWRGSKPRRWKRKNDRGVHNILKIISQNIFHFVWHIVAIVKYHPSLSNRSDWRRRLKRNWRNDQWLSENKIIFLFCIFPPETCMIFLLLTKTTAVRIVLFIFIWINKIVWGNNYVVRYLTLINRCNSGNQ